MTSVVLLVTMKLTAGMYLRLPIVVIMRIRSKLVWGLLTLAVVAAMANQVDKNHDADKSTGKTDLYDDMNYLIKSVGPRFTSLKGHDLSDNTRIQFKDATRHRMTYKYHIYGRGEIHHGTYHYKD